MKNPTMHARLRFTSAIVAVLLAAACHGSSAPTGPSTPVTPDVPGATSPFGHVFVVTLENHGLNDVLGNPRMPYWNGLAAQYGLATEYYASTHPSIGNYFMLTVGNIVTNDDNFSGIVTDDNVIRQVLAAGKTWKSYAEDLPSVGYTGPARGGYAPRHNVAAFLSDVVNDAVQVRNLVPFSQFAGDLSANTLPNYAAMMPNLCNSGHDCGLDAVDAWLQANLPALIASSQFQKDGLLIVVFDEAADADVAHGGGHVPWLAVAAKAKRGYRSSNLYQHDSTLRLVAESLRLPVLPNRAAFAPGMTEFFSTF